MDYTGWKKRLLVLILVFIILIIIWIAYMFYSAKVGDAPAADKQDNNKLTACIEDFSGAGCKELFIDPQRYKDCGSIANQEIKDKCFYKCAEVSQRSDICSLISNAELKDSCYNLLPGV